MAESHPGQGVASVDKEGRVNKSTECRYCDRDFDSYMGRRKHEGIAHDEPYQNENVLRDLYVERGMSMAEIANEFGVKSSLIDYWLKKHDIQTRDVQEHQKRVSANFKTVGGYERWSSYDPKHENNRFVQTHRLLAVAEHGFDAVCDMDVHHKNGIPWDNRPGNIELLTRSEHTRLHQLED
jgi:transposase-like protein